MSEDKQPTDTTKDREEDAEQNTIPTDLQSLETTQSERAAMTSDTDSNISGSTMDNEDDVTTPEHLSQDPNHQTSESNGLLRAAHKTRSLGGRSNGSGVSRVTHKFSKQLKLDVHKRERRDSACSEAALRRKAGREDQLDSKRKLGETDLPSSTAKYHTVDAETEHETFSSAAPPASSKPSLYSPPKQSESVETPVPEPENKSILATNNPGTGSLNESKGAGAKRPRDANNEPPTNKGGVKGGEKGGAGKKKRKQKKKPKVDNTDNNTKVGDTEEGVVAAVAALPTPAEVFVKGDAIITLTVTKQGEGSDAIDAIARILFLISDQFIVTTMITVPDGALIEVADTRSAEVVQSALTRVGWTVEANDVWARYEFTVPSRLAGTGPTSSGLDPTTLVRGLMLRNAGHGLPAGSIRYVSHNWETVAGVGESSDGSIRMRLRIWVDVSPEGEHFLREHAFLLETIVMAVRLRQASRSRLRHDRS